jgi:cytoskeleton protein RodZ
VELIVRDQTQQISQSDDLQEENGRDEADYLSFMPGQRLKKARELRGMTIEQVAQELSLSPRYVVAMESDSYKSLPEPAFVRGYMRRYAQLVKLSPDDIAAKFDQCYAEDKETPEPDIRPRNPIQLLGVIARRPRLRVRRLLSLGAIAFAIILVAGFLWNGIASHDALPVADEPTLPEEQLVPVAPEMLAPAVPGMAVPTSAPLVPAPVVPGAAVPAVPEAAVPGLPAPAPAINVLPAPAGPAVLPTPAPAPVAPPPTR